mmetsp:Transcript_32774/g.55308  ORF Transcript_32774/g.55308 Transcript_32774/m.55308 type:complete len:493 (-) Transcript_32774:144-1622(-)
MLKDRKEKGKDLAKALQMPGETDHSGSTMSIEDEIRKLDQKVATLRTSTGGDDTLLLQRLIECAKQYRELGSGSKAIPLLEKSLNIADQHPETDFNTLMKVLGNLGREYDALGQYENAIKAYDRLVCVCTAFRGRSNLITGFTLLHLAKFHGRLLHGDEALTLFQEASAIIHGLLPSSHPNIAEVHSIHGEILHGCYRYDEAVSSYKKALAVLNSVGTIDQEAERSQGDVLDGLSSLYVPMKKYNESIQFGLEALPHLEKGFGTRSKKVAHCLTTLGTSYVNIGELKLSFAACSRALEINIETEGYKSVATSITMNVLAELYAKSGRYDDAVFTHLSAYTSLSAEAPDVFMVETLYKLSGLYVRLLMYDEATHYVTQALDIAKHLGGNNDGEKLLAITYCQSLLIVVYERKGLHREAAALEAQLQLPMVSLDLMALPNVCASCFQSTDGIGKGLLKCGVCHIVWYCTKECQKSDWPRHRRFCKKTLKNTPSH